MIEIVDHRPEWAEEFEAIRARLLVVLEGVDASVEHVGSTSVPGLAAKPVLDVTIVVPDDAALARCIESLERAGARHRGDLGVEGREAFERLPDSPRHHLYAGRSDAAAIRNHLAIRDRLRADPAARDEYARLKRTLARTHANDIDRYCAGKTEFLTRLLREAGFSDDELASVEKANRLE